MKKILVILLTLNMIVSLVACGGNASTTESSTATSDKPVAENVSNGSSKETEEADDGNYTAYAYDGEPIDLFTIEEVVLMPTAHSADSPCLYWKMKVRNTSGEDIPMKEASMRVWYRYLDKNEDILWDNYMTAGYDSTIKDGRAEWMEMNGVPSGWTADDVKNIEYIEIFGYTNTLHGAPDYEFTNPVLIKVSDFVDWDKVINK